MRFTRRVPVAWLNLTHSLRRFLLSVFGISFAVVLMFVELGFWRALLDSQTALLSKLDADLVLVSVASSTITDTQAFPIERIEQRGRCPAWPGRSRSTWATSRSSGRTATRRTCPSGRSAWWHSCRTTSTRPFERTARRDSTRPRMPCANRAPP